MKKGEGVVRDPIQAMNWFLKSANNGNPEAQYNAALKYYTGNGTHQDLSKSIEYAEKSAMHKNKPAIQLLVDIYSDVQSPNYNTEKENHWKSKL
ncbi:MULTISPECIES: tetratricopeptide repeat protein [Acinetobacter]|uniref:tetratricopeptide repeat protein n=1 Tax=Acinetobacter TaxID=469 RepID=UPI000ACE9A44|nr:MULTISPECIES: tetratricopeptide repeat protein [Acinetobacter]